jgi:hypothetical protein
MRSRIVCTTAVVLTLSLASADSALAQQTLNFTVGYFTVRGEDARAPGDVLVSNRGLFLFDFADFNSATFGAEWLAPIGEFLEAGAGIGFARRTVPTMYDLYVRPDGSDIEQDIRLRVVPLTATVRVLPLGRHGGVQPYVGGGLGIYNWRYSETGDFIDFTVPGRPVFRESYVASGTSLGPVAMFGVRFLLGNTTFGGELQYRRGEGELDERDFLGPTIDLGGVSYTATFGIRF